VLNLLSAIQKRPSLKNAIFVSGGNIFNSVLGFIYLTAIARALTLNDFGKYSLLISLLMLAAKGSDFGTNNIYVTKSITQDSKDILGTFISSKLLLTLIVILATPFVMKLTNIWDIKLFLVFTLAFLAYVVSFLLQALFQKEERFFSYLLTNLIPALIKGVFSAVFLLGFVVPNLQLAFAIFGLSIMPVMLMVPFSGLVKNFRIRSKGVAEYLKEAVPAGLSQIILEGWPAINNSLTSLASNFSNVGVFSLANKISNIFGIIAHSLFTVLLPKNAILKKASKSYDLTEMKIISVGILILAGIATVVSQIFIKVFFGTKFAGSITILHILIFSSAISAIHVFMESYFYAAQKIILVAKINLVKLATFVLLAIPATFQYSITGLAITNLICSSLFLIVLLSYYIKLNFHISKA